MQNNAKYVLPRFIYLSKRNKETARVRADWVPQARGDVLEVGIGPGLNLRFYSAEVRRVYGVEPSAELQKMARKRMASQATKVEFFAIRHILPAEERGLKPIAVRTGLCGPGRIEEANYAAVSVVV